MAAHGESVSSVAADRQHGVAAVAKMVHRKKKKASKRHGGGEKMAAAAAGASMPSSFPTRKWRKGIRYLDSSRLIFLLMRPTMTIKRRKGIDKSIISKQKQGIILSIPSI